MQLDFIRAKLPIIIGVVFLLLLTAVILMSILNFNGGFLTYTLDDPYIHLSLAENIAQGHYGLNTGEFSAPSSSIIWPFILAPFAAMVYFPLVLNVIFSLLTIVVFARIFSLAFSIQNNRTIAILSSTLLVVTILATNMVGLIFCGMEHSLQLLVISLIALGLIIELETDKVSIWFMAALVFAPLVRYENMAVSIVAIGYLFLCKYYKKAGATLVVMGVLLGAFSLFLTQLGLAILPTSVLLKSAVAESGGSLIMMWDNLKNIIYFTKGTILALGVLGLMAFSFFSLQNEKKKRLALTTASALVLHLLVGQFGWYNRYEIYIWAFLILVTIYLAGTTISKLLNVHNNQRNLAAILFLAVGLMVATSAKYISDLKTIPLAANNVYEQHFQMHRFAVEFYKKPIAVNDVGYISYQNDSHILDLWGLGSLQALKLRTSNDDTDWMAKMVVDRGVDLVIVYPTSFAPLPDHWLKLGELHLGNPCITLDKSKVDFFAVTPAGYEEIKALLPGFTETLPQGVTFLLE